MNPGFYNFSIAVSLLDIFISVNTGFYIKGQIVMDRQEVLQNYFNNYFLIDLLSLIPMIVTIFVNNYALKFLTLLYYIKMKSFSKIIKKLEESFQLKPRTGHVI